MAFGRACIRNVAFERYFAGIAVAFKWCFWGCMGGLLLVGFLVVMAWHVSCHRGRHFNCVLHPRCTLVAHDISGAFAVLTGRAYIYKEKAVCVACDKENKCRSHPKVNMKDSQVDFAFSTAIVICARFLFD